MIWAAAAAGTVVGYLSTLLPEWAELLFGIPAILIAFGAVLWTKGFRPEDRELFRMRKADIEELQSPRPGDGRGRHPLVAEVPHSREDHRQSGFVGGGDDLVVADRTARLDHRRRARFDRGKQPVGEREEGVRGDR